nr:oligosaccharide flippase family protein [uncultured Blautia sp.]
MMNEINQVSTSKALFKNTGIIAIGQVSTKLINFLLLPLYTALLTKEQYGLVDLLSTYTSFIVVLVSLQLNQAIFRFLVTSRESEKDNKEIISTIMCAVSAACLIYSIIFICIQQYITVECKWYLLIQVLVTIYLQTFSGIARGLGYNTYYAIGNFLAAAVTLVINVIVIAVFRMGVGAMLVAYVIGPFIGMIYLLIRCKVIKFLAISQIKRDRLNRMIHYALPLIPNELSWSLIHSSDRMIISAFMSITANGLIAVASKFSLIYTTFFSIFNTSWTEQVVLHYNEKGGTEYISNMFNKMVTFFGTLAIGIIAVMPLVFNILVNKQFADAYGLIPLYMIAVFFNVVIGMISAIYLVENETKFIAISTMLAAFINIVVDLLLVNFIGVYAAPISSIAGYATISFWRIYDINKRHCEISVDKKNILMLLIILGLSIISFYFKDVVINIVLLIIIIIIAIFINKDFLLELAFILKASMNSKKINRKGVEINE